MKLTTSLHKASRQDKPTSIGLTQTPTKRPLISAWDSIVAPRPLLAHPSDGTASGEAFRHQMGVPPTNTSTPFGPHSFGTNVAHPKTRRFLLDLRSLGISQEVVSIMESDLQPAENEAALISTADERFSPREMQQIKKALEIARRAHAGQTQKRKKEKEGLDHIPYFNHCVQVARMAIDLGMSAEAVQASLLHDVVEDTPVGMDELGKDFPQSVLTHVADVTRQKNESRADYLERVKGLDATSSMIKVLDRLHNLVRSFSTRDPEYLERYITETASIYRPKINQNPQLHPLKPLFETLLSEMGNLQRIVSAANA